MTATLNGSSSKSRPSLALQINRLDHMLDGLADGLNEAVADAVQAAVGAAAKEAVQAVLIEVLTNPEVLAKLQSARMPAKKPTGPTMQNRLAQLSQKVRSSLADIRQTVVATARKLGEWVKGIRTSAVQKAVGLWQARRILGAFKWQLMTAAGAGTAIALAAWFGGPEMSAVLSGVGGFCTMLAVHGWLWLRKVIRVGISRAA